jgi:nucleotide-binding universal stress UspA family protein
MGKILCATRGGEASQRTQDAAIALAKERGDVLILFYVADISFLNQTAAPVVVDVASRLEKMGHFQLKIAQEKAIAQGVEAQVVVRRGQLRAELIDAAQELGVDLIVLGRPLEREAIFDEDALRQFADLLQEQTEVQVRIL